MQNMRKIKKAVPSIESKVKVHIGVGSRQSGVGGSVTVKGSELDEFLVEKIVRAIDFGFDIDDALLDRKSVV